MFAEGWAEFGGKDGFSVGPDASFNLLDGVANYLRVRTGA